MTIDMKTGKHWLQDLEKAGVWQLADDPREFAQKAAALGLQVHRIDIDRVHGKRDLLALLARTLQFPATFGGNWDALADCLKDLSWSEPPGGAGWVVILERAKHYCAGHREDFTEAMDVFAEAAEFWRGEGRPFWTFIAGPEGWASGWPAVPAP